MKEFYSAAELSDLKLDSLNVTERMIKNVAKKENWPFQKRKGRGGGIEYALASLPEQIQGEIRRKCGLAVVVQKPKLDLSVVRQEMDLRQVSEKQIAIADARMAIAQYFLQVESATGLSRNQLKVQISEEIKGGSAPQAVLDWAKTANAKQRERVSISPRTLYQWVMDYENAESSTERLKSLVPLVRQESVLPETEAVWLMPFLARYQIFSKPSVEYIYRQMSKEGFSLPHLSKVRRVLKKLLTIVLERGRRTGAQMKAILPFVRRDWEVMDAFEVFVADGHSFKARVKNIEGFPYVPEITVFIDGRTRLVVGWSVSQSESVIAVSDAFRHAVTQYGLPNMCYSDNGRGQKNKTLDADITGLLPRLGVHHTTGKPGNPQGRGIIERLWQSFLIPLAKSYPTYHGDDADESVKHYRYRKLESAIKAVVKNKELTDEQQKHWNSVPHFEDFMVDVKRCVAEYNQSPHSKLPQKADGEHYSPMEYAEKLKAVAQFIPNRLDPLEVQLLFRPEVERVTRRGEIEFDKKIYFNVELAAYSGDKVRVSYDIHDASNVIVKSMNGDWLCVAHLDANKQPAFGDSVRERAAAKSLEARNKRLQARIDRNNVAFNPVRTIEHQPEFNLLATVRKPKETITYAFTYADKEEAEKKKLAAGG